jgi:chemotaxis protein CheD
MTRLADHAHAALDRREMRVHVPQGEFQVSADPHVVLTSTLGSCISACLHDPLARVGGMNHFLLPDGGEMQGPEAVRYGAFAMELLVNALLRAGARRDRLQAKLFGGGHLMDGLADIGDQNATFAERFLEREGVPVLGGSVRGPHARRVQYWPATGRARALALMRGEAEIFAREASRSQPVADSGVELFGRP